jgi:hypothetical protein
VAVRAGSAAGRGLPSTRRDIHDDSRRGTNRTPQHDSLLITPGITLRLPFVIALIAARITGIPKGNFPMEDGSKERPGRLAVLLGQLVQESS